MDELIAHYAQELQGIYDNRTAGDHTFIGVLSSFLHDVVRDAKATFGPVNAEGSITYGHDPVAPDNEWW